LGYGHLYHKVKEEQLATVLEWSECISEDNEKNYNCMAKYTYQMGISDKEKKEKPDILSAVYSYRDDANQIEYIKISNFENNEGNRLKQIISEMKYNTVIIDLRGNYGGSPYYFERYIYPYLYEEDLSGARYWMTNRTKYNNKMIHNLTVFTNLYSKSEDSIIYKKDYKLSGAYEGEKKNVYYLVDENTASAADGAATLVKDNELGTVVGGNTSGEGLGQSFICDILDNSGLVFIYYSAVACSESGEKLYSFGTEPDVYITASYEEYLQKMQFSDGKYENLIQYDPLIKWVIENKE